MLPLTIPVLVDGRLGDVNDNIKICQMDPVTLLKEKVGLRKNHAKTKTMRINSMCAARINMKGVEQWKMWTNSHTWAALSSRREAQIKDWKGNSCI